LARIKIPENGLGSFYLSPITAKTYTTQVICLRAYDFGEADKILHFYSPDHGRISAIAKGVKKAKSKLAGACELLNLSEVQLSKGKNLDLLCQYQPKETFIGLRSDLLKLAYGLLFSDLINQTAIDMDSEATFHTLKQALNLLDQAVEAQIIPIGLEFQLTLLHAAGFHPVLNECIFTQQPLDLEALYYCFSPQLGGVTTSEQKRRHLVETKEFGEQWINVSTSTLKILENPYLLDWNSNQFYKAQKFLQYYFKQVFEKQFHSYDLVFNLLEMTLPNPSSESYSAAKPS
jgi:DNA repair protein RecO (recombination protein O)